LKRTSLFSDVTPDQIAMFCHLDWQSCDFVAVMVADNTQDTSQPLALGLPAQMAKSIFNESLEPQL